MFFTEYIRKNTTDISIMTKEDFDLFDKEMYNDGNKRFMDMLYNPFITTLFFDKGVITFQICEEYEDEKSIRICLLHILWKSKDGKVNWNKWKKQFYYLLRLNKCTKMKMYTELNPEFWVKNYGFKQIRHEMELDL